MSRVATFAIVASLIAGCGGSESEEPNAGEGAITKTETVVQSLLGSERLAATRPDVLGVASWDYVVVRDAEGQERFVAAGYDNRGTPKLEALVSVLGDRSVLALRTPEGAPTTISKEQAYWLDLDLATIADRLRAKVAAVHQAKAESAYRAGACVPNTISIGIGALASVAISVVGTLFCGSQELAGHDSAACEQFWHESRAQGRALWHAVAITEEICKR